MYDCITDANGDPVCKNKEQSTKQKQRPHHRTNGQHLPGPTPKGVKQACSGSCLDPDDCDISNDCLCASDKGACLTTALISSGV